MPSSARRRIFRSTTKWDPWVIPLRFKLLQRGMIQRLSDSIEDTVGIEQPTMDELTFKGIPQAQWPYLIGFNKKMLMIYRTFTGATLFNEKVSLIEQYKLRGYEESLLLQLQDVVDIYAPGQLFENRGFETGDTTGWTVYMGSVQIVTTEKHSGTYSCQLEDGFWGRIRQDFDVAIPQYLFRDRSEFGYWAMVNQPAVGPLILRAVIEYSDATTTNVDTPFAPGETDIWKYIDFKPSVAVGKSVTAIRSEAPIHVERAVFVDDFTCRI